MAKTLEPETLDAIEAMLDSDDVPKGETFSYREIAGLIAASARSGVFNLAYQPDWTSAIVYADEGVCDWHRQFMLLKSQALDIVALDPNTDLDACVVLYHEAVYWHRRFSDRTGMTA